MNKNKLRWVLLPIVCLVVVAGLFAATIYSAIAFKSTEHVCIAMDFLWDNHLLDIWKAVSLAAVFGLAMWIAPKYKLKAGLITVGMFLIIIILVMSEISVNGYLGCVYPW